MIYTRFKIFKRIIMSFLDNFRSAPPEETDSSVNSIEPQLEHMLDNNDNSETAALGYQRDLDEAKRALERAKELQQEAAGDATADPNAAAQLVEQRERELEEAEQAYEQHSSQSPESAE